MNNIECDRFYIIGPIGDQCDDLEYKDIREPASQIGAAVSQIEFIKDIKDLPPPDELQKDIQKLMIFDDVGGKEPVINE